MQSYRAAWPDVDWRYLIMQKETLSGLDELNFDHEITWPIQENGRK
jgi:hypothetical protein